METTSGLTLPSGSRKKIAALQGHQLRKLCIHHKQVVPLHLMKSGRRALSATHWQAWKQAVTLCAAHQQAG